jgi:Fe2+ transport system protein FeoA
MAVFIIRGLLRTDQFSYPSVPYFEDVPASHPSFRYVQKMKELGITTGCSTTPARYCADELVSRAQMAVFLIRSKYGDGFAFTQTPYFSDVTRASSEFAYVQKLRDLGITSGCSATEYCGSASTTRGQMASFLVRTFLTGL